MNQLNETDKYEPEIHRLYDEDPTAMARKRGAAYAKFIKTHCRQWLKESGGKLAYRGVRSKSESHIGFVQSVRPDRIPSDTSKARHNEFNKLIALFGLRANRSNAVFASGNRDTTGQYGAVYVIFPIGNFNYTWSPEYRDWSNDFSDVTEMFINYLKPKTDISRKKFEALVAGVFNRNKTAMSFFKMDQLKEQILGDDGSLIKAIRSYHEIMIKCEKVLYISEDFYNDFVKPYFLNKTPTKHFDPVMHLHNNY